MALFRSNFARILAPYLKALYKKHYDSWTPQELGAAVEVLDWIAGR